MSPKLALAPLLLLCACALPQKEPPPKPVAGTRWDVVLELPLPGEQPWFRFGDGRMEGFAGCNHVTAQYLQDSVGAGAFALRYGCSHALPPSGKRNPVASPVSESSVNAARGNP